MQRYQSLTHYLLDISHTHLRSRIFALIYIISFSASALAVPTIAILHSTRWLYNTVHNPKCSSFCISPNHHKTASKIKNLSVIYYLRLIVDNIIMLGKNFNRLCAYWDLNKN